MKANCTSKDRWNKGVGLRDWLNLSLSVSFVHYLQSAPRTVLSTWLHLINICLMKNRLALLGISEWWRNSWERGGAKGRKDEKVLFKVRSSESEITDSHIVTEAGIQNRQFPWVSVISHMHSASTLTDTQHANRRPLVSNTHTMLSYYAMTVTFKSPVIQGIW